MEDQVYYALIKCEMSKNEAIEANWAEKLKFDRFGPFDGRYSGRSNILCHDIF